LDKGRDSFVVIAEEEFYNNTCIIELIIPESSIGEMKYLHDNGLRVINMADLVYNNSTHSFSIKNS